MTEQNVQDFPMLSESVGKEKKQYELPTEDIHEAVVCELVDRGEKEYLGVLKREAALVLQLEERDSEGRRKQLWAFVTLAKFKNGKWQGGLGTVDYPTHLRKIVEAVECRKVKPKEVFDPKKLLGGKLRVQVVHKPSADGSKTFGKVATVMPSKNPIEAEDYTPREEREKDKVPF